MSFEKKFIEAIDEAFASISSDCNQIIYDRLEEYFRLDKLNIPKRIEDFSEALEGFFGFGAKVLEIRIMKNLYQKMEITFKYKNEKTLDFVNYIQSIKNIYYPHLKLEHQKKELNLIKCIQ